MTPPRDPRDKRSADPRKRAPADPHRPETVGDVLSTFLRESGMQKRIEQAAVVPEWATAVGPRIAAQTEPLYVTSDGTLFVAVRTHAWMSELQLMIPELIEKLNAASEAGTIRRIRFRLLGQ